MRRVYQIDCETGEMAPIDMDWRAFLIYYYGLPEDTTLEDAEAIAAQDENAPEPLPDEGA